MSRLNDLHVLRDRVDCEIRRIETAKRALLAPRRADAPPELIRAWARANGVKVANTGQISRAVRAQYLAAQEAS